VLQEFLVTTTVSRELLLGALNLKTFRCSSWCWAELASGSLRIYGNINLPYTHLFPQPCQVK